MVCLQGKGALILNLIEGVLVHEVPSLLNSWVSTVLVKHNSEFSASLNSIIIPLITNYFCCV